MVKRLLVEILILFVCTNILTSKESQHFIVPMPDHILTPARPERSINTPTLMSSTADGGLLLLLTYASNSVQSVM